MISAAVAILSLLPGLFTPQAAGEAWAFYPTQPGDTWTYESSLRGRFTNEVVDPVLRDGPPVFRIRSTDAAGREQMFFGRHDGSRLYQGPREESMTLLADFSLEAGASSSTRPGGAAVTLKARHESLDVFGHRFPDVAEVHVALHAGSGLTYYFARGIGLVGMRSDDSALRVRLVTATVGGIRLEDRQFMEGS
jgi:hypothetical protein